MSKVEVQLAANTTALQAGLDRARALTGNFSRQVQSNFSALGGVIGAMGIGALLQQTVSFASRVGDISNRFGVGTDVLQKWGLAAQQNGLSIETLGTALGKLAVNQSKALSQDKETLQKFAALGITFEQLKNLNVEQLFQAIARGSLENAEALDVMGRSGKDLIPLLEQVRDGTAAIGSAMSDEAIRKIKELEDRLTALKQTIFVGVGNAIVWLTKKIEVLATIAGYALEIVKGGMRDWRQQLDAMTRDIEAIENRKAPQTAKRKFTGDDPEERERKAKESERAVEKAQNAFEKRLKEQEKAAKHEIELMQQSIDAVSKRTAKEEELQKVRRENWRETMTAEERLADLLAEQDALIATGKIDDAIKAAQMESQIRSTALEAAGTQTQNVTTVADQLRRIGGGGDVSAVADKQLSEMKKANELIAAINKKITGESGFNL